MDRLFSIIFTAFSVTIIYAAWGEDAPVYNFALVFGGILLGHVLTEALNHIEGEDE